MHRPVDSAVTAAAALLFVIFVLVLVIGSLA